MGLHILTHIIFNTFIGVNIKKLSKKNIMTEYMAES